jgi:hypothetical protein
MTTTPRITIEMTQTTTRTYNLTEEQLEELGLPSTVEELSEMETDVLGVSLLDNLSEDEYAVTERDLEISDTSE